MFGLGLESVLSRRPLDVDDLWSDTDVDPWTRFSGAAHGRSSGSSGAAKGRSSGDASGDAEPQTTPAWPRRDTSPLEGGPCDARARLPVDVLNNRPDVGNIGFMFGNLGSRASSADMQGNIDLQIKRGPAQILGLCECEQQTQDILESAAVAADPAADPQSLGAIPGFEYWTVRGNEDKSNLLVVRKNVGRQPVLLFSERLF